MSTSTSEEFAVTDDIATSGLVEDGLETVEQARQFLQISRSALYQLMDTGRLAYVKLGKSRRVPRRALVELARQNLVIRTH
jgi:excisionase family DNA binding protein